ncbi:MAG TPA: hypothetical protein VHQ65_17065 [Thermoanaerobaculia bacterium]|nr:hypothetical protein [Thermoanaerobaculia bacterium]
MARWLEVAFHETDGTPRARLQRWSGDLALSAAGTAGPDDLVLLRGAARRLAEAAPRRRPRLEYRPTSFVVRYLPPVVAAGPGRGPEPRVEADCPADAAGHIRRAEVRVPTGDWIPQARRDDLALEGLLTCLGLAGRLPPGRGEYESVLAAEPNWGDVRLTGGDLLTLSVHFDPALAPGLTPPEALAALGLEAPAGAVR